MIDINDYDENKEENTLIENRKMFVNNQKHIKYYPDGRKERLKNVINNYYKNKSTRNILSFSDELNSILNSFIFVDYNIENKYDFNKYNFNSPPENILDDVELSAVKGESKKDIIMRNMLNKFKQQYPALDYNSLLSFLKSLHNSQAEKNFLFVEHEILRNEIMPSSSQLDIVSETKDYIIKNIINPTDNVLDSNSIVNDFLSHFDKNENIICQIPNKLSEIIFNHKVTKEMNKYYSMHYDDSYKMLLSLYVSQFSSILIDINISNSKNTPKTENSITTETITLTIDDTPIEDVKLITTDDKHVENSNSNLIFKYVNIDKTSNMFKCISMLEKCKDINKFPSANSNIVFFTNEFITEYLPDVYYAKLFDASLNLFSRNFYPESINLCKYISSKIQMNDNHDPPIESELSSESSESKSKSESRKMKTIPKQLNVIKPFEPHSDSINIEKQSKLQRKIRTMKAYIACNFGFLNILLLFTLITILVVYFMTNQQKPINKNDKNSKNDRESFDIKNSYNLFNY